MMEKVLEMDSGNCSTTLSVINATDYSFKNGKFYVMDIYDNLKQTNKQT